MVKTKLVKNIIVIRANIIIMHLILGKNGVIFFNFFLKILSKVLTIRGVIFEPANYHASPPLNMK